MIILIKFVLYGVIIGSVSILLPLLKIVREVFGDLDSFIVPLEKIHRSSKATAITVITVPIDVRHEELFREVQFFGIFIPETISVCDTI